MTYNNRNTNSVRMERSREFDRDLGQGPHAEGNPNKEQREKDRGSDQTSSGHEQNRKEHKEGSNG